MALPRSLLKDFNPLRQGWATGSQIPANISNPVVPANGMNIDRTATPGTVPGVTGAYQPSPLDSPIRTTAGTAYSNIQSLLPNQGTYKPVDFSPIKGLDDNYYQSLTDNATKSLRKQYFDDDNSVMNQFNRTANQRGILGSGVEFGGMQDIYKDFGSQLADVTGEIGRTKAEKDYEVAAKNADMYQQNAFQNQKGQFDLAQLGIGSALDEASNATKFDTDIFTQGINYEKILADLEKSRRDSMTGLIGEKTIGNDNRENILSQLFAEWGLGDVGSF